MEEFIFFVCTDSTEIFSKLRSAGLNYMYNLPSFFSLNLTVRGVSKHCLLTFFIQPTLLKASLRLKVRFSTHVLHNKNNLLLIFVIRWLYISCLRIFCTRTIPSAIIAGI